MVVGRSKGGGVFSQTLTSVIPAWRCFRTELQFGCRYVRRRQDLRAAIRKRIVSAAGTHDRATYTLTLIAVYVCAARYLLGLPVSLFPRSYLPVWFSQIGVRHGLTELRRRRCRLKGFYDILTRENTLVVVIPRTSDDDDVLWARYFFVILTQDEEFFYSRKTFFPFPYDV